MVGASSQAKLLVIACGALAHEIVWLQKVNGWAQIDLQCLDAELHNKPKLIPQKLRAALEKNRGQYQHIFIGYGDCGTGGEIDRIIAQESDAGHKKLIDCPVRTVIHFMPVKGDLMIWPSRSWVPFT